MQQLCLEEDPLIAQEANKGIGELKQWKLPKKKLTPFARPASPAAMLSPLDARMESPRGAVPGFGREPSSTEELKVYTQNQNGEVQQEEKRLVRPQSVDSGLGGAADGDFQFSATNKEDMPHPTLRQKVH